MLKIIEFILTEGKPLGKELEERLARPGYSKEQPGRQYYDDPSELD